MLMDHKFNPYRFLIESLGDLKPDPAESSAKTLLLMSQTLAAIANGQTVTPPAPGTLGEPPFSPSKTAVVVNLLWLLSLSLSIAVSLIAMLAKDWCYKFLSSRVGPAYEQARRRQLKWNGIERWKMKEVLTYLPGMMHTALLLFAVGLCFYLWDINTSMAIPVIAVTGIATLVYVLATILPAIDRFCPYSTPVIPVLADTATLFAAVIRKPMLEIANASGKLGAVAKRLYNAMVHVPKMDLSVKSFLELLAWELVLWFLMVLKKIPSEYVAISTLIFSAPIIVPLMLLLNILLLVARLLQVCFAILLLMVGQICVMLPLQLISRLISLVRSIVLSITIHYELKDANSGSTQVPMDLVTSQMLAWLIANCENSRSVDIALQAISGADNHLPGAPLAECRALKLVLLRLEACIKFDDTSSAALRYYRASGVLVSGGIVQATEDRWSSYFHPINDHERVSYIFLHSDHYDGCRTYRSYAAYFTERFGSRADLNTRATIAIAAMPFFHWDRENYSLGYIYQGNILEITIAVLKQHLQADSSGLSTIVLGAIVRSTVHYLVGLRPREERRSAASSVLLILLSHIFFMSYGATPDIARDVAITLAAAEFATHAYHGGEEPSASEDAREKRAVNVYTHYRAQEFLAADMVLELFIFGFFGFLPEIDFDDDSIRATAALGDFGQLIQHRYQFDLSQKSSIYTLPQGYSLGDIVVDSSRESLTSFINGASFNREAGLAYSGLLLLTRLSTEGNRNYDTQANLCISALIALCSAESTEVQDLCLHFIDAQPIPKWPLKLLESAENRDSLEQLCRVLIDRRTRTPVASIAALHFELLVARVITHSVSHRAEIFDGQSALRPLLELQNDFVGRISQPKQLDVEALLSGLGECCKGDLTAEEHILHTMQSIADFCELTEAGRDYYLWYKEQELQKLKDQLKPSSDRVARQGQAEPESIPLDVLPSLELPNSGANVSF
ncbi:hypothetical protein FRC12_012503 [Ceratobasidium sp. 428]|nr:hypothetical protein FRC12_012503 [Ceratobasidium sp. 428]